MYASLLLPHTLPSNCIATKDGLRLAVHFVSLSTLHLPPSEVLGLCERAAHALGEYAAMAMLYVVLTWALT